MSVIMRRFMSVSNAQFMRRNTKRFYCSKKGSEKKGKNEEKKVDVEKLNKNIEVEKFKGVMTLNIDRQCTRNSLDLATLAEMTEALNCFDQDQESQVLVIHGEGGSFCSGYDIEELDEKGYNVFKDASIRLKRRPLCDKPTIAAVAGYAVAEGFELALACDLRVIEDTAMLGCLGRRFGLPQSILGEERLTSLVGLSHALDLLITGRLIEGKEAHRMGLACKLTSTGTALGEAMKLGKSLLKFPQAALIIDKMLAVHSVLNPNTEDCIRNEAIIQSHLGTAVEDLKVGIKKFLGGIGKHGKFYQLSDVPVKDWELEESYEEIRVVENKKNEKK